ncbi:cysteine--1-D-myo-inosityl 2-amino-2-deoxy-alpha-D-glucopyranoside ligase [Georgenia faecalis]|uniref:L-cysteine:1D-myo-inositol 2-amino-2-deoxy-alpha-D-glucopyranoside ligase n=1 Tax=Georgenia faecalis TaxID=2483799 RepID=A0ABV9DAA2_9MICO|nr:cysteine--1-D-myo-inosityl 2-amino-2-deoxy-alpha-D-glucopyranoside ligase [Georgenia faecalis]
MQPWSAPPVPQLPGRGGPVRLYDSARGGVVTAGDEGPATLYVCGITPYDATHIGHASTYIGFDLLVRAWLDAGREVHYVQNVTDVDDPLLERATATGIDWRDLAQSQTELFFSDMVALRALAPEHYVGAVESIPLVVDAVTRMLDEGTAYRVPLPEGAGGEDPGLGDVYADLSADPRFGSASGLSETEMAGLFAERGGDPDRPGKRHPLDPLLWLRSRPGEPTWDGGALGSGRPGWHIECACIAGTYLGVPVEVQGGGSDLAFPHHEMSESHLRVLTGQDQPVHVHAHGGMVAYQGAKMSKSLGNLVLVSQLVAAGEDPMAVRLALIGHHYRDDWEISWVRLRQAQGRLARWRAAFDAPAGPAAEPMLAAVRAALANDLDSSAAITAVDAWVARVESGTAEPVEGAPALARQVVDALLGIV